MEKSKFNFATVFSIMILLIYTYITFLGMVYWQNGKILLPLLLAVAILIVVGGCVFFLCKSKFTRWKRNGLIGQIFFGTIILAVFILSAAPFTNFLYVLGNNDRFTKEINEVMTSATELDETYTEYAHDRLDSYQNKLELVSRGKESRPSDYENYLAIASGTDDDDKMSNLTNSLKRKLLPDSLLDVQIERESWLLTASNMTVWNIQLPSNIARISDEVQRWVVNYERLSETIYEGEDAQPFSYPVFKSSLNTLRDNYVKLHSPSFLAIVISLICFFIMLLPFWMTRDDPAGRSSGVLYE